MVESGQLVAQELTVHVATDVVEARGAEHLEQQEAQPVAHVRQGQGRRALLPPVCFAEQEPHGDQGQGHVVMPALPGAHLVRGGCTVKCVTGYLQFLYRTLLQVIVK